MKKLLCVILALVMVLGLVACGSGGDGGAATGEGGQTEAKGVFKAGFGMVDITPSGSLPLGSYGDDRMSTGMYSYLEARAVVVQDENGDMLVFCTVDTSWFKAEQGKVIRAEMSKELGIPEDHFILSGTHTHGSVSTGSVEYKGVPEFNATLLEGSKQAIRDAVADLKPAELYAGSAMTENLNFVKRYIMDDGSLLADNYRGTGSTIVRHETDADPEMKVMKFVREGGKDIVIGQFQAHPHLEGKSTNIDSQVFGAFRDSVEAHLGVHCLAWNGAAGNLNSHSRIPSEMRATKRTEWGELLYQHLADVYDTLPKVETGPIQVMEYSYMGNTNHDYDHLVSYAQEVVDVFKQTNSASKAADYAYQQNMGIHSYYHASRIIGNAGLPKQQEIILAAWSFGDVAGVVLPYEMFDTSGMRIKSQSPYTDTFIVGYSYPSYITYIPTAEAFEVGGYTVDNCKFAAGTAEEMEAEWLKLLNAMYEK